MASEIRREHVYANFRPSLSDREKAKRTRMSAQERREGNSEAHLALLRLLPCCVTGNTPCGSAHHLKSGPAARERGVNMRATDKWGLPLAYEAHILGVEKVATRYEHAWFREHGIDDPYELAAALWQATGDLERMRRVLQAHVGRGRRGR